MLFWDMNVPFRFNNVYFSTPYTLMKVIVFPVTDDMILKVLLFLRVSS